MERKNFAMEEQKYKELLYVIDDWFNKDPIIQWSNGLKVKCRSFTGICETDIEPDEEDYIVEYTIGVNEVEILEPGSDDSVEIFDDSIEICLLNIPEKIMTEDGSILWQGPTG